jgi:hypothetical protein
MWELAADDRIDGPEFRIWAALTAEKYPLEKHKWFKDYAYTTYPLRAQLQEDGLELILGGWKPTEPFITPETRVLALGSCFAG